MDGEMIDEAWIKEKGWLGGMSLKMFKKAKDGDKKTGFVSIPIPTLSPKTSPPVIDKETAKLLKKEEARLKLKIYFRKKFRKRMPDYRRERLKKTKQGYRKRAWRKKKMFYCNPVFKLLLQLDIDNFVRQQPPSHLLTPAEEELLSERRLLLADYYHTMRLYNMLPSQKTKPSVEQNALSNQQTEPFDEGNEPADDNTEPSYGENGGIEEQNGEIEEQNGEIDEENGGVDKQTMIRGGTKSYAEQPYNHQFKGTLSTARRLFAITREAKRNPQSRRVTKYDQPLFKPLQTSE